MKWIDVWKSRVPTEKSLLEVLLELNGHDHSAGKMDKEKWKEYVNMVKKELMMQPEDSVFEVGCGAGAFLYTLNQDAVGGCDYAPNQIRTIKKILHGKFYTMDAEDILTDEKYDYVISNSVFQYLSIEVAETVLHKMLKKANKAVAVLDIPDKKYEKMTEHLRRQCIKNYDTDYQDLKHTYYSRDAFNLYSPQFIKGSPSIGGGNRFGVIIWV